jgi:hypothetical protein
VAKELTSIKPPLPATVWINWLVRTVLRLGKGELFAQAISSGNKVDLTKYLPSRATSG